MNKDRELEGLLRRWWAQADARGERASLEASVGIETTPNMVPVPGVCRRPNGTGPHDVPMYLTREPQPSGALRLVLQAPPVAEGAEVSRLLLVVEKQDGEGWRAAGIPMGVIRNGTAEVLLSAKAVAGAPIPLARALVWRAEVVLAPMWERALGRLGRHLESLASAHETAVSLPALLRQQPGTALNALQVGACGMGGAEEVEHTVELSGGLTASFVRIATGELHLCLAQVGPSAAEAALYFAVSDAPDAPARWEGYAKLFAGRSGPARARFALDAAGQLPTHLEVACLELISPEWEAADRPILEWSADHAIGPTRLKRWLGQQLRRCADGG